MGLRNGKDIKTIPKCTPAHPNITRKSKNYIGRKISMPGPYIYNVEVK
jgi:hypothetical protein